MPTYTLTATENALAPTILGVRYIRFTVTTPGTVTIDTASNGDSTIQLFERGAGNDELGALVAANDDSNATLNSQLVVNLPVGTYVLAVSQFAFTDTEAREGANFDEQNGPFNYTIDITTGTAAITPPTLFNYGDADAGNNLAVSFGNAGNQFAVANGDVQLNVSGLDRDATGTVIVSDQSGNSVSATVDHNGHVSVPVGSLQDGDTLTAQISATDLEGFDAVGAGDTSTLTFSPVVLLDADNNVVGGYSSIQDAIDAASDGYTIVAGAGTFVEDLTVDKDVTITGANEGVAGDGTRSDETIIDGSVNVTADGVTIDGVEITGTSNFGGFDAGIQVLGADFTLANSVLNGPDLGGSSFAILTGTVTGLDIGNNLIEGYAIGAYVSGGTTTGSIHDNSFQGVDGTAASGLGNGVNSESSHVAIADNSFDSLYAGVLNLFPFGPDLVDLNAYVSGNIFTNVFVRPIQVYPTSETHNIIGTDVNESFNGDTSGVIASFGFSGGGGDDHIFGGELADSFDGGSGNDLIEAHGGDDVLRGGTGTDTLVGGTGNDAYYVDEAGDFVTELAGEGRDTVFASASYALAAAQSVELLSTASNGATTAIDLLGNELNQEIYGNAGNNTLSGGGGTDFMVGLGGNDIYYVDSADDVAYESAGQGSDIVYSSANYTLTAGSSIELLSAASIADTAPLNLTGNELVNTVWGNNGNNVLSGGGGADTLVGFGGNDNYTISDGGEIIVENAGGGTDIAYASVNYTLSAGAEVELLSTNSIAGTDAINLTGNELANSVWGNNGVNTLNGGLGADTLLGFGGNDVFAFTTALGSGNVDRLADFSHGNDKIGLDDAVFTGLGGPGALNANAFATGAAAGDADDRIIYNGATGQIFYDADGNGAGAAILFASVDSGTILTASDFQVI